MTGRLPNWIERLLGIEAGPGEGTVWSLDHSWGWPPWATLLLVAVIVGLIVAVYLRESATASLAYRLSLAAVRVLLAVLLLGMIAQYALLLHRTGLPYLAVLVDDSASMATVDRYDEKEAEALSRRLRQAGIEGGLTRLNLARLLLLERDEALLRAMGEDYKLRVYYLEDSTAGARASAAEDRRALADGLRALEPDGASTRLGSAVRSILGDLRGTAPAAIVLLTDGITTEGPSLAEAAAHARRSGVPLYAVGIGDQRPARNVKLADLLVDDVVFVDDVVNFEFKLSGEGFEGRTVTVTLREEDDPRVLAQRDVTIEAPGGPQQVRLPYRPTEEGDRRYVLEAAPLEGEVQTEDNRVEQLVHVRKEQIGVLLVEGYPNYEFRYLRNMLDRDPTVRLHTVLQEADPEYAGQDETALRVFPVRREELFDYDVIILGDVNPSRLGAASLQNLADFVDQPSKGGALVFIAGPRQFMPSAYRGTPLERLFPFDLNSVRYPDPDRVLDEGFSVTPTELGLATPPMELGDSPAESREIWNRLPPVYWMIDTPDLKPAARVLAAHPTRTTGAGRPMPLVTLHYVGAGKVLFHATDATWRWRWRVGDVFFARYWIQAIRYLSRSKLTESGRQVELAVDRGDRAEYRLGEPVRLRVTFVDERLAPAEDDGVSVVLERRGGKTERIKLHRTAFSRGVFEALRDNLPLGAYHAWLAAPTIEGKAPAVDFSVDPQAGESERLQMDAVELRRAADLTRGHFYPQAAADRLLGDLPEGRQVPVEALPPEPLWNRWPVLLLFLVLLVAEWALRKKGGMV